jgi:hypothetical protein
MRSIVALAAPPVFNRASSVRSSTPSIGRGSRSDPRAIRTWMSKPRSDTGDIARGSDLHFGMRSLPSSP